MANSADQLKFEIDFFADICASKWMMMIRVVVDLFVVALSHPNLMSTIVLVHTILK